MTADLAPVALFTFKRPLHTRRTLEALARNPEFLHSPLHVYCDGPRRSSDEADVQATREVVRQWPHPDKAVHEAAANRGLAASITAGVTDLCRTHGRVIVVEDDLVVSPHFLAFLNAGLRRYADDARVMQISGHMFPTTPHFTEDALFLPMTTSWGWATWQRAWKPASRDVSEARRVLDGVRARYRFDLAGAFPYARMLADQLRGKNDSWAIWWYLHVHQQRGLVLFPGESLVSNEGFDGSGTHCQDTGGALDVLSQRAPIELPSAVEVQAHHLRRIRRHLITQRGVKRFAYDNWRRWVGTQSGWA